MNIDPRAWRSRFTSSFSSHEFILHSLAAGAGIATLCLANFGLHHHYPNLVAWFPTAAALGLLFLLGARMLPAIVVGNTAGLLASGVDIPAAVLSASISGATCLLVWALLHLVRPIDRTRHTVSGVARLFLTGCVLFGLGSYLAGPASVSSLIHHGAMPADQHTQAVAGHHAHVDVATHPAPATHGSHHVASKGLLETLLIDVVGVLLLMPVVSWLTQPKQAQSNEFSEHWRGACCTLMLLTAVTFSVYSGYLEDHFGIVHTTLLVLPPAVWLALEYGLCYTLIGNLVIFFITGIGTSLGHGPFKDHSAGLPLMTVVVLLTTLLIAASRSARKEAEETIQRMASHDALTGVTNRTAFTVRIEQALHSAQRYEKKIAVMFIDLDRFKHVNDTLGHQAGDLLLIEVSRRLLECIRSDSVLARFGGDEFVILVDHVGDSEALALIAKRISNAVSRPFTILGHYCEVGCSIGISIYPNDGTSSSELMKKADAAMYRIKKERHAGGGFMFHSLETYGNSQQSVLSRD